MADHSDLDHMEAVLSDGWQLSTTQGKALIAYARELEGRIEKAQQALRLSYPGQDAASELNRARDWWFQAHMARAALAVSAGEEEQPKAHREGQCEPGDPTVPGQWQLIKGMSESHYCTICKREVGK